MFGNRIGWGLAVVLGLGTLALAYMINQVATTISRPSRGVLQTKVNDGFGHVKVAAVRMPDNTELVLNLESNPALLEPLVIPFKPTEFVPGMLDAGDPGPIYAEALAEYNGERNRLYDKRSNTRGGKLIEPDPDKLPGLQLLIKARLLKGPTVFGKSPEKVIKYVDTGVVRDVQALVDLGELANAIAFSIKGEPGKQKQATELAEAAFALGYKMAEERLRIQELEAGIDLIRAAAATLAALEPDKADAQKQADAACKEMLLKRIYPMEKVLTTKDKWLVGRTVGDVFYIVKNSKERLWRIEGLLRLGEYKTQPGGDEGDTSWPRAKATDQRQALLWAKRIKDDPNEDPAVRAAAKEAVER